MPEIILRSIAKTYPNGHVGLLPIDLSIADGECLAILGPSGSGKSTLLRLISGLERADSGTLEIGGIRCEHEPPHKRGVSFVTQRPTLYPQMDVAENLAASLRFEQPNRPHKERVDENEIRRRVTEAATIVGLSELLRRRVHELSGGEQQRVVFGRAIVARRRIWLLDEPFGHLDSNLRDRLCRELHLLRRRLGLTIVHVTHDPNEATTLADRVGVLGDGRLLQAGTPEEVLARPSHRTVAFCLGWPPVNFIDGIVKPEGVNGVFVGDGDSFRLPLQRSELVGKRITLGIRPEEVKLEPIVGGVSLGKAEVIASQPLAGRWLMELKANQGIIRSVADSKPPDEWVEMWVDPAKVHWFDGVDGKRIA